MRMSTIFTWYLLLDLLEYHPPRDVISLANSCQQQQCSFGLLNKWLLIKHHREMWDFLQSGVHDPPWKGGIFFSLRRAAESRREKSSLLWIYWDGGGKIRLVGICDLCVAVMEMTYVYRSCQIRLLSRGHDYFMLMVVCLADWYQNQTWVTRSLSPLKWWRSTPLKHG
jgi:hypothetical protein